jgi:uncharacterized membrane protein
MTPWAARRAFPPATLDKIGGAVAEHEKRHRGQVRFVIEAELTSAQLWRGMTSRQRAVEVFSMTRVWDTQENAGVLVYVLLADRKVEVVADRGISAKVPQAQWEGICRSMGLAFAAGKFSEGAMAGVAAIANVLATHFPSQGAGANELPDRPVLI